MTASIVEANRNETSHELRVSLAQPSQLKSLIIMLPWPVRDDLKGTLHRSQRLIKLVLNKSLFEPWPSDRSNSEKWDIDNLEPWNESKNSQKNARAFNTFTVTI